MPCKLLLIVLIMAQTRYISVHSFCRNYVAQVYFGALVVMTSCLMPSIVCTVRFRDKTLHFAMQSLGMMLATIMCIHHLLCQESSSSHSYTVVFTQVILAHVFYIMGRTAHEHQFRHLLLYSDLVCVCSFVAMCLFPALLSVRFPAHEIDMPIVMIVMVAGELMGSIVMLVCVVLRAFSTAYQQVWDHQWTFMQ